MLGPSDGPEALAPCTKTLWERVGEIGARERCEAVDSGLSALFNDLSSARVAEHSGVAFHNGLRTEARAQASPSRREIDDEADMEQLSEKGTPAAPEKTAGR